MRAENATIELKKTPQKYIFPPKEQHIRVLAKQHPCSLELEGWLGRKEAFFKGSSLFPGGIHQLPQGQHTAIPTQGEHTTIPTQFSLVLPGW